MSAEAAPMLTGSAPEVGKVRPLSLADIDRRTAAYRNSERLLSEILSDLGGEKTVSTAQRELAGRAAVLAALIGDQEARALQGDPTFDLGAYLMSLNAHRRLLATIGLERRARPVVPMRDRLMGT